MDIKNLLQKTFETGSSDLHMVVGSLPMFRTYGKLNAVPETTILEADSLKTLLMSLITPDQQQKYIAERELDFSFALPGVARFRCNYYIQRGTVAAAFRVIPVKIPTIEELQLPQICHTFAGLKQGFILVTGPTGSGKSSTLAAILEEINVTRAENVITIEDPIEFEYSNKKSIFSQREVGGDTKTFERALKSALREDPNVVLVGEMRDLETIKAAITTAETGHLVFSTLHTNSAAQTIDRIIDSFPEEQQDQIRTQLANSLEAVFAQRLIPTKDGKRIAAYEVMVATPAIKSNIREGKTHQIDNIIQTGAEQGMILIDNILAQHVNRGIVDREVAYKYCNYPTVLSRLIGESR